jgi:hypothetical protein
LSLVKEVSRVLNILQALEVNAQPFRMRSFSWVAGRRMQSDGWWQVTRGMEGLRSCSSLRFQGWSAALC